MIQFPIQSGKGFERFLPLELEVDGPAGLPLLIHYKQTKIM